MAPPFSCVLELGEMKTRRSAGSWIVIAMFSVSGVLHLVSPNSFIWLMPPFLPWPEGLVYLSGVAELLAAGLLLARQRLGPLFTALVLVAVWPANWWYAIDIMGEESWVLVLTAWVRLPLQLPLIWWAWRSPVKKPKASVNDNVNVID